MDAAQIVAQLRPLGQDGYKRILLNHGVVEPVFGVKIEELKKIQKMVKKDYQLALDLYDTGIYDAMYLAGLIADDKAMSQADLRHWVRHATSATLSQYTVPWVAAQGVHGRVLALEWIDAAEPRIVVSGWATLSSLVALTDDDRLDLAELRALMQRVQATMAAQPPSVQSAMTGFLSAVGSYVAPLTQAVTEISAGPLQLAAVAEAIRKLEQRGTLGKKRKTVKC